MARLYGLGVGPGDPELVTLKAARILRSVPVVGIPVRSEHDASFAFAIVEDLIDRARQEVLELVFPMTRDHDRLGPYWDAAADRLHERIAAGHDAAFITEGDPFFHSTFIYVFAAMRRRHPEVPIEVVPGVSSVMAAAAAAQSPLVNKDERLAVLPTCYELAPLRRALAEFDTVVLLKISSVGDELVDLLAELGRLDDCVFVQKATTADEIVIRDVRALKGKKLEYLSLLIVRRRGAGGVGGVDADRG